MASTPWLTSNDLLESVKRRISFPVSQSTFTDEEILALANEELFSTQVPSVLQYHEEYFVTSSSVTLEINKTRYPIPDRAIGMRLRDLFWSDQEGNLSDMTKVSADDKAFYQRNIGSNQSIHKYFVEGNEVVLTPSLTSTPTGSLVFSFFLRPNLLVKNDRAAIIASFGKTITVGTVTAGSTVIINSTVFTAVSVGPTGNQFLIGGTPTATASNLATTINASGIISSASSSAAVVTLVFSNRNLSISSSDSTNLTISSLKINFSSIPSNIVNGSIIDFLQTKPGHRTLGLSKTIPSTGISSTTITFTEADIPTELIVGDYICLEHESIIPYLPPDLHNGLAERTAWRILAALGDQSGLQTISAKLQELNQAQGQLLDSRVEGSPIKVTGRHSLLKYVRMGFRRRL